jgi:cobalt-zinc-cadmium efflux system membrane fusion protein
MRKLIFILFVSFLFACTSENKEVSSESATEEVAKDGEITLTQEQIKLTEIETAKVKQIKISETIECTGKIEVPPKQKASISPIMGGFIQSLNYNVGDKVEKGSVLATLQHPDFINLQKEYLNAKSQKEYFEQEYKRQGELTIENAASIKKMQKAKTDFLSSEANYKSLKSHLKILGVNVEAIENDDFTNEFKLITPISGTISNLAANTGKFVNSENCIYEIINESKLNIQFNIFERDISKIRKNQKIIFHLINNETKFETSINRIGAKIDSENRSTLVYGNFDNINRKLKSGMHINASILINEQSVNTIPASAIADGEDASYIFIRKGNSFKRVKINKGIEQDGYCELIEISDEIKSSEIVIKGSYYLMSAYELNE